MRNLLAPVLRLVNPRTHENYLTRWSLLTPKEDETKVEWKQGPIQKWLVENVGQVYLHKIDGPDPDKAPHNHPWLAVCFVLRGGYVQQRYWRNTDDDWQAFPIAYSAAERVCWVNVLGLREYHRIVSVKPGMWTLCICGPAFRSWGFLMSSGRHMGWREYLGLTRGERSDHGGGRRDLAGEN
jgi:hypothetical protein